MNNGSFLSFPEFLSSRFAVCLGLGCVGPGKKSQNGCSPPLQMLSNTAMRCLLALLLLFGSVSWAEDAGQAPPRDIHLVEKKLDQLANQDSTPLGTKALSMAPAKWKHAETDHFIVHYRRATEAQRVVREIEFALWYAARSLGVGKERYAKKSHIYVFQDTSEWEQFRFEAMALSGVTEWSASFAHGDELFLHIGGPGEGFDSETLAHETTHAVVARLYPGHRWPKWLNEGFAEFVGTASIAARKGLWTQGLQKDLPDATMAPLELVAIKQYPKGNKEDPLGEFHEVHRFYQSSQKLVRFLMTAYPKERFPRFVDVIVGGATFEEALLKTYGDQVKDFAAFGKQYERFSK